MKIVIANKSRVSMSVMLFILMLVSVRFFDFKFFEPLMQGANDFTWYMLMLAFMYMRFMGFERSFGGPRELKPLFWMWGGFLLSFVAAYVFYGQGFMNSLIVTRNMFAYLTYPLLLAIRPSYKELKRAFYAFSIVYLFSVLTVTFIAPSLIVITDYSSLVEEGDFVHGLDGLANVLIAFGFAVNDFRVTRKRKYLYLALLLFVIIFLIQNRSILFSAIVVFISLFLFDRSKTRRLYSLVLLLIFGSIFVVVGIRQITGLIAQTVEDLSNPEYNRVKALIYFFSSPKGWLGNIIGSGFISGRVNPLISDLMRDGIYYSDVGLIGMWHQFGLVPVLVILVYIFKGLNKNHSFMVKTMGLGMLCCSLTVGYFFAMPNILWFSVYLYLFFADSEFAEAKKAERDKVSRRLMQRYRSIAR